MNLVRRMRVLFDTWVHTSWSSQDKIMFVRSLNPIDLELRRLRGFV